MRLNQHDRVLRMVRLIGLCLLAAACTPGLRTPDPAMTLDRARELAEAGVSRNSDWAPFEQDFNGVTMLLVPVGCFIMGSSDGEPVEQPVHEQCMAEPFWLDKYEVSNRQFGSKNGIAAMSSPSDSNLPRRRITWFEARDFCVLRGGRLPTEAEWEFAARGPDGWVYPWGNEFVADNVVFERNSGNTILSVGSRPGGASWVGVQDLSGNVSEWVSSRFLPYPYDPAQADSLDDTPAERVVRGGNFFNAPPNLRAALRSWGPPTIYTEFIGFRCARSL